MFTGIQNNDLVLPSKMTSEGFWVDVCLFVFLMFDSVLCSHYFFFGEPFLARGSSFRLAPVV